MRSLFLVLGLSATAGAATLGQQTITLSATPAALTCSGQRYVNKLTIRVIPGFAGKVFVGNSGMDPVVYTNTLSILFPNLGAHSEEYVVQDPSGDDGIDLCSIYLAGEIPGENAVSEYVSNNDGTVAPAYLLVPTLAQVQPATDVSTSWNGFTLIRAQAIPGYTQQVLLGQDSSGQIILAPNVGDITQHSAWSEKWERSDPLGANGLNVGIFVGSFHMGDGALLMSGWQKQTNSGTMAVATTPWTLVSNYFDIGDLPAEFPSDSALYGVHVRRIPGPSYNGKDEWDDAQGNASGILFPNTTGAGWSEEINFGSGAAGQGTSILSNSGNWDRIAFDFLVPQSGIGFIPAAMASVTTQIGGYLGGAGSVPIGRGYVKRLRVQVVPGGVGKIYIGSASMDIVAFTGVYAILYPNAIGRWSETLEIEDPEGDGISTNDLYIQTDVPGEQAIVSTLASGVAPPDGVLTVKASGALAGLFSSYAVPFAASSTPISFLRAQAIPGGDGKVWIGTGNMTAALPDPNYANTLKILWPSQGDYDIAEGFSERFVQECRIGPASAPNCLDLQGFTFWPEIPSEQLLVFALGR
jgi:hypothetical protein